LFDDLYENTVILMRVLKRCSETFIAFVGLIELN
jgi:hypothetical protein